MYQLEKDQSSNEVPMRKTMNQELQPDNLFMKPTHKVKDP